MGDSADDGDVVRLALVILAVADVARAREFYSTALAWHLEVDEPVYVELASVDGMRLGLYERTAYARNTSTAPPDLVRQPPTATELYFLTEDVPAVMSRLHGLGAPLLSGLAVREWGDEAAYFADPDGNVVVVARRAR